MAAIIFFFGSVFSCFIWYLEETPLLVGATLSVASVEFYSIVYMLLLPFTSCGRSFGLKC